MALACKITGHKWNKLPNGNDGCTCSRCGKRRDEGHDWQFIVEEYTETVWLDKHHVRRCAMQCSICGRTKSIDHDWDGCICTRCGTKRNRDHVWGKAKPSDPYFRGDEHKTHHTVECVKCGKKTYSPHTFERIAVGKQRCTECGFEINATPKFRTPAAESDYYAKLIASGEVGYYDEDIDSKKGRRRVNYGDHVTTVPALTRLFIALADNDGADNHAPEGIARKLNEIAKERSDKADDVSIAFSQIACDESVHIYWRSWVAEHDWIKDPELAKEARESVARWREAYPRSQADIDYENALIASDSGLYTTG